MWRPCQQKLQNGQYLGAVLYIILFGGQNRNFLKQRGQIA